MHPLILGPSIASNADVLSYPAFMDNGNGLIKKAVDRINHSFPQASSLALPNEMRLAKRNQPITQLPDSIMQHQGETPCLPLWDQAHASKEVERKSTPVRW